jgi:signal transduction histidine kinase
VPGLTRALLKLFVLLLIAGGVLFAVHDYQVSRDLAERLQAEQVQAGKRQTRQFSEEVRRTLERYQFRDLIDRTRGEFVQFEKLSEALLNSSEYVSYVHWKNERGETLLFKGPDSLQRFVISEDGVTYQQSTTSEVREIRVERPGRVDRITDITTPILVPKGPAGSISVGLDEEKILKRAREASSRVRNRTLAYSGVGLVLVAVTFLYVRALMRKVSHLSASLEHRSHMAYVGTLASGLVHEIRNPLNGINLNLSLLEDECREGSDARTVASLDRILGRIRPNLAHLETITNEFLMFARPSRLELADTTVGDVVNETAQFLRPQAEASGLALAVRCASGLPQAKVDREKLRQVVLNLAVNAIQATPPGGTVTLEVSREAGGGGAPGSGIEIAVADSGPGIEPERQRKLFTLFYSTKERGVGLGLPIVKKLVEDHGGTVSVSSSPGSGTVFRVRLPLAPPAAARPGADGDGAGVAMDLAAVAGGSPGADRQAEGPGGAEDAGAPFGRAPACPAVENEDRDGAAGPLAGGSLPAAKVDRAR